MGKKPALETTGRCSLCSLPPRVLEHILSHLWFNDLSSLSATNRVLHGVINSEPVGLSLLLRLGGFMYRNPAVVGQAAQWASMLSRQLEEEDEDNDDGSVLVNDDFSGSNNNGDGQGGCGYLDFLLFARRLPSWPTGIDVTSLVQEPRNVKILSEGAPGNLCAVYGGRRKESHKGYAVVATDDHFPCLPGAFTQPRHKNEGEMQAWERLPRVELQKAKKESVVSRSMAPFTRLLQLHGEQKIATLSCVAYFEATVHQNTGYSAMDDIRRFSVGLACALFPLRKKQLGFDNYSFAYHRDGHFVHGNRRCGQMTAYSPGDTVGCGLVYPPLTGVNYGKIFFTKNGDVVGMFDMGVEGLLSLPWFPAVGLAPSIPMEFNFGHHKPFVLDLLGFEARLLSEHAPSASWPQYSSLALEQEGSLWVPRHPVFLDAYYGRKKDVVALAAKARAKAAKGRKGAAGSGGGGGIRGQTDSRRRRRAHSHTSDDYYGASRSGSVSNCSHVASRWSAASSAAGSTAGSVYGNAGGVLSPMPPPPQPQQLSPPPPRVASNNSLGSLREAAAGGAMAGLDPLSQTPGRGDGATTRLHAHGSHSNSNSNSHSPFDGSAPQPASQPHSSHAQTPATTPTWALGAGGSGSGSGGSKAGSFYSAGSAGSAQSYSSPFLHQQHQQQQQQQQQQILMHGVPISNLVPDHNRSLGLGTNLSANKSNSNSHGGGGGGGGGGGAHTPRPPSHVLSSHIPHASSADDEAEVEIDGDEAASEQQSRRDAASTGPSASASASATATASAPSGGKEQFIKCIPSHHNSLYLDADLRAATLMEITDTRRVVFGGSDASWEGTGEEDSDDEDDDSRDANDSQRAHVLGLASGMDHGSGPEALLPMCPPHIWGLRGQRGAVGRGGGALAVDALQNLDSAYNNERAAKRRSGSREEGENSMAVELSSIDGLDSVDGAASERGGRDRDRDRDRERGPRERTLVDLSKVTVSDVERRNSKWVRRRFSIAAGGGDADADADADEEDEEDEEDTRSIATSLFVEVASLDEGGSYIGYGGASDSDEEGDEGDEGEEVRTSRTRTTSHAGSAGSLGDVRFVSAPSMNWGSGSSVDSAVYDHSRPGVSFLSLRTMASRHARDRGNSAGTQGTWDRDTDGYDGASERGRCETDGVDDLGTEGGDGEEGEEDVLSQSSHFDPDGSLHEHEAGFAGDAEDGDDALPLRTGGAEGSSHLHSLLVPVDDGARQGPGQGQGRVRSRRAH